MSFSKHAMPMPKLLYISMMRMPTEKAHGLQIMQNCEAFADAGYELTLWVSRRWNTRQMRQVKDPFAYYGVNPNFAIRYLPCIDLFPLFPPDGRGARLAFYLLLVSYSLVMTALLLMTRADVYYSREEVLLALLSWLKPKYPLTYEVHLLSSSKRGAALTRYVIARVGSVIAITPQLRQDLIQQREPVPNARWSPTMASAGRVLPPCPINRQRVGKSAGTKALLSSAMSAVYTRLALTKDLEYWRRPCRKWMARIWRWSAAPKTWRKTCAGNGGHWACPTKDFYMPGMSRRRMSRAI